jgi:thymidylate kinase
MVADAVERVDWDPVRRQLASLRAEQSRRTLSARPLYFVRNVVAGAARRVRRSWRSDRGLSVVVLGPDGSGKSSVIAALRCSLSPAFVATDRRTFPPGLLRRGAGTNPAPHAQRPRSSVGSAVRAMFYWLPYCIAAHLFVIRPARTRGTLVLHDRHLVDAIVDPRRYRYAGPAWLLRMVWRLVPKPDLVILLDAPAEVIQSRKQEVPLAETRRQLSAYRTLMARLPNAHVVDAGTPIANVVASVEDVILGCLARRASHQLGREARR